MRSTSASTSWMRTLALAALLIVAAAPVQAMSLKKLATTLKKKGLDHAFVDSVAAELGLARSVTAKFQEVDGAQSKDGSYRVVFLFPSDKPEGFVFMTNRVRNYRYEKFYARTDLAGAAKAGLIELGEIYPDGTVTRNEPAIKRLLAGDPALDERLAREMDFWLRGRGRGKRVDPFDQPAPDL